MIKTSDFEKEILETEWINYLRHRRDDRHRRGEPGGAGQEDGEPGDQWKATLTGLAVSGGGIRSAAFSLGVLQHLAEKGLLDRFDYLSTVSGGGYTGGSASYFAQQDAYNLSDKFPYGRTDSWADPSRALRYLRSHGNYLTPDGDINSRSLAGIVIRAVLLNLVIWLPIVTLAVATIQRIVVLPAQSGSVLPWVDSAFAWAGLGVAAISVAVLSGITRKTRRAAKDVKRRTLVPLRTAIWAVFTAAVVVSACAVVAAYPELPQVAVPLASEGDQTAGSPGLLQTLIEFRKVELPLVFQLVEVAAAAVLAAYLLSMIVYSLRTFKTEDKDAYERRRGHAKRYGVLLKWLLILVALAAVPYLTLVLGGAGGAFTLASGVAIGIWKLKQQAARFLSLDAVAPLLAVLVLGGMFVVAYGVAYDLGSDRDMYTLFAAAGIATALGYLVNLNHISIGRYYRDRLMEAFMPSDEMLQENSNGVAKTADNLELKTLVGDGQPRSPLHIVNTNVVLVDSKNRTYRKRGGDSFVFTPLHVGSAATSWVPTWSYYKGAFTLPTAVAISGAAVNPNAGPAGSGLTRNRSISLLMSLLNLRLGYWAPNPGFPFARVAMNHFWSAWYELSPEAGHRESATFVQLSDGGHFDNLGLYELFRRRVRFILVLDGGQDADFQFEDLQNALHLAEQDFKVRVKFDGGGIGDLIPQEQESVAFPSGLKLAETGFVRGEFSYADRPEMGNCQIYLVKTTLVEGLSMRVLGYKGAHPEFPDETTVDQFFDEDQFDAYRLLGADIARTLLERDAGRFEKELLSAVPVR